MPVFTERLGGHEMKLSQAIKPISYVVSNASEVLKSLDGNDNIIVITHNGIAKAVLMSIKEYELLIEKLLKPKRRKIAFF
jgi:prevent-host-death family protein